MSLEKCYGDVKQLVELSAKLYTATSTLTTRINNPFEFIVALVDVNELVKNFENKLDEIYMCIEPIAKNIVEKLMSLEKLKPNEKKSNELSNEDQQNHSG